jgi:hypothetical protein
MALLQPRLRNPKQLRRDLSRLRFGFVLRHWIWIASSHANVAETYLKDPLAINTSLNASAFVDESPTQAEMSVLESPSI